MSGGPRWALYCVALGGCARTAYTPVDWLLDIDAALPVRAATIEICVQEGVMQQLGPADGRYAVAGLPLDRQPVVQVSAYDDAGAALGSSGWVSPGTAASFDRAPQPCVWGPPAPPQRAGVLGVRFLR